jgi:hypothetical protein
VDYRRSGVIIYAVPFWLVDKAECRYTPHAGIVGGTNDRNVAVLAQWIHQAVTAAGAMTKKLLRMRKPAKP